MRQLTPLAPDPAALRGRLVEGRAKNPLPAGFWVVTAGQVKPLLGSSNIKTHSRDMIAQFEHEVDKIHPNPDGSRHAKLDRIL